MKVLFSTKTWQEDYKKMLAGSFTRKWKAHNYPFDEKWLILNNIDDHIPAAAFKSLGAKVIVADDHAEAALNFFGIKKADLGISYVYSICELVELYLAKDFDFLVHQSSDIVMTSDAHWVRRGMEILQNNDEDIVTVAPNNEDSVAYGLKNKFFSDQCYLVPIAEFRRKIYWFEKPELPEYPPKAGDALFERRVGRYLHNLGKYRQLISDAYYSHPAW